jgi:hypothetical protein
MFAPRRILALAGLAVTIGVLAGSANAEPKNQWPFTRPVASRGLSQNFSRPAADPGPRPEAKNELPFTRAVVVTTNGQRHGSAALAVPGGNSGGIDWPLAAWVVVAATILTGGAVVFLRSTRFATERPV